MNNLSMALKNLKKNFSFYALYLLSVSFVITVFFAFTSFSMNTVMLEKISGNGRVEMMCNVISVFLMAFVVFYMSYSNRFFLRRRTKELGVYALLGYRKTTVLSLLTTENLLVCFGAFIVGILLGIFFHKGIVFGITKLLDLSINNSKIPFFNVNAIAKTACFIFAIVIVLMLSNSRFLFKTSLMGLVRFEKSAERKMKFHAVPSIVGFCCIILGYVLALDILRGDKSVWFSIGYTPIAMLTLVLVVVGTILFISSFLPFVVHISKNNKRKFYTETKIITSPNFIYRMRSNSKTLIMLTLLSAATLTVSSVMALSLYYPIAAVSRMAPSEIECRIENESEIDAIKQIVNEHSSKNDVSFLQTNIYKVTSTSEQVPLEYSAGSSKGDSDNEKILRNAGFECISYSNYMALLEAQGKKGALEQIGGLHDSECILVKYQPASDNAETGNVYPLLIGNEEISVTVIATTLDNPISFANSIGTLIVSDDLYDAIAEEISPETEVLSINGQSIKDNEALFLDLSEYLNDSPYLQGTLDNMNTYIREQMQDYHPTLLPKLTIKENYQNLLDGISQSFPNRNLCVSFDCSDSLFLVEPYNIFVYRLLKELVTNVYKHSTGEKAWITLTQDNGIIILSVSDNGTVDADVLSSADRLKHRGLAMITERVNDMDGSVTISNNHPHGICVQTILPMKGDVSYQHFVSR